MEQADFFYTLAELQECAYARVLLTGDPKCGKTVSVLKTAPLPIALLNCDLPGAPQAALRFIEDEERKQQILIKDITCAAHWGKAVPIACKLAKDGKIKTIVVDTITLLVNNILGPQFAEMTTDNFKARRDTIQAMLEGVNALCASDAHVFFVAHYAVEDGLINLEGRLKKDIPGIVADRVHLDFDPARKVPGPRAYMIGPSASGLSGGRKSDENKLIKADVMELLKEFKINP